MRAAAESAGEQGGIHVHFLVDRWLTVITILIGVCCRKAYSEVDEKHTRTRAGPPPPLFSTASELLVWYTVPERTVCVSRGERPKWTLDNSSANVLIDRLARPHRDHGRKKRQSIVQKNASHLTHDTPHESAVMSGADTHWVAYGLARGVDKGQKNRKRQGKNGHGRLAVGLQV